jgi:hypothetical protein
MLKPSDEKNRRGSEIPLRHDLADDLREWLAEKLDMLRKECLRRGEPAPAQLSPDTAVFNVPRHLAHFLNKDLKAAGIPKVDERGRTIDVHGLRHTFGTFLSKGGVPPRTAQAAMRHSTINLTMNVYTDPKLLDVHGALDVLPSLDGTRNVNEKQATCGGDKPQMPSRKFAPRFAPTTDNRRSRVSTPDTSAASHTPDGLRDDSDVSGNVVTAKQPLSSPDNAGRKADKTRSTNHSLPRIGW